MTLPHLFSPLALRGATFRNRIFSTGHQTCLVKDGRVTEDLVAYHRARARGGAALIVVEAARMHESAVSDAPIIDASRDDCIPGYRAIAQAVQPEGCRLFAQLAHPGRVTLRLRDGLRGPTYSASTVPDNRFKNVPRQLSTDEIADIVASYGRAAARFQEAGLDGVEVTASHGVLPAQFLNPKVNLRSDDYGGPLENRIRFLTETIASIRRQVGPDMIVGLRISLDEMERDGLTRDQAIAGCRLLAEQDGLDYFNVIAGSMAGARGSIHVVPPMAIEHGYLAPAAAELKAAVDRPVFVAGRINQPQIAERIIAQGQADMCGMTRAMIADPEMAAKAAAGRFDDIRACIGCNQACIGHFHSGLPISCIQHPETGRERRFADKPAARPSKRIVVAGGGPAGMKAAAVAAERGHAVTLYEAARQLGGQTRLAQTLPGRAEFGGIIANLEREMALAGVEVRTGQALTREAVLALAPDAVILATGATPLRPRIEGAEEAHLVDAWQVLRGEANPGAAVLIADWRCDWIGMGLAEHLVRAGCHVRLAVDGTCPGENLQSYLRDHWAGVLHGLGVEVIPYARLFGADADHAYLEHTVTSAPIVCEGVDTVVLAQGHRPVTELEQALDGLSIELRPVGDCLSPRTAEEAVYEGMVAGLEL